jgi:hypothetical protein
MGRALNITRHARQRMSQRAIRETDIELICECGTPTTDGYLLRNKDAERAIAERKAEIERLGKLEGHAVIATGSTIVTAYPANRKKQKKMLRMAGRRQNPRVGEGQERRGRWTHGEGDDDKKPTDRGPWG